MPSESVSVIFAPAHSFPPSTVTCALSATVRRPNAPTPSPAPIVVTNVPPSVRSVFVSPNFAKLFPLQYESWIASKEENETADYIAKYPFLAILRAGTGGEGGPVLLGLRGHYYGWLDFMTLTDAGIPDGSANEKTSARCLACHSSAAPEIIRRYGEKEFLSSPVSKYSELGAHSVGCMNCHDPETMQLKVSLSWFNDELKAAGKPTSEKSSAAEQKSLICAQCHYEGFTVKQKWTDASGKERRMTVAKTAWPGGFSIAAQEAWLNDGKNFPDGKPRTDLIHPISIAPLIWSIHSDYELFKPGIHGQMGLSCTTCHMPKVTKNGQTYTSHNIGRPLKTFEASCSGCHDVKNKDKILSYVAQRKARAAELRIESGTLLAKAHLEAGKAWAAGASEAEMQPVLQAIRASYWRFNSLQRAAYFHASQETFTEFANAIRYAQQARVELRKILARHGAGDWETPAFDTKDKVLALLNLPEREAYIKAKCLSNKKDLVRWTEPAEKNGTYDKNYVAPDQIENWHTRECSRYE